MGHKRKSQLSLSPDELLKKAHSQIQKLWAMDSNAESIATASEVKEEKLKVHSYSLMVLT